MIRRFFALLVSGLLVALLAAGGFLWWLQERYLPTPGPLAEETLLLVPRGSGVNSIANRLAEAGAIDQPLLFRLAARVTERDRALKAGEYRLMPSASPEEILLTLTEGEVILHPLTLVPGITVREALAIVEANEALEGPVPEGVEEGALLPETYLFPRGTTREAAVNRMRRALDQALQQAWDTRDPDLPLDSPEELLVLASIIEKETAVPQEYGLVASVFANRLNRGMRLQTDPTVIYALTEGQRDLGRELTRADLKYESPYNTYTSDGLPPTPIALAGKAAIDAAAHPEDTDFLYFVADGSGGHAFATTLQQHNNNVAQWRQIRRQQGN